MCELEKVNFESNQVGGIISDLMEAAAAASGGAAAAVAEDGFEFDHGEGGDTEEAGEAAVVAAPAYNKRAARLAAVAVADDNSIDIDAI